MFEVLLEALELLKLFGALEAPELKTLRRFLSIRMIFC